MWRIQETTSTSNSSKPAPSPYLHQHTAGRIGRPVISEAANADGDEPLPCTALVH
ncbi:hypothetical protein ACFV83_29330 [Streptomyces pharetrae]|jgi:hypothetical protein|uniref:hypothetical protein n=1 Tax=Streptomyces pharetrae TaxID=291370 RepID=UPI003460A8B6